MLKLNNISITAAFFILGLTGIGFSQTNEQITLTTYYPSPYGSYVEVRARRVAIGDNYISPTYCWPPTACANPIEANADLVVEGNVGIGIRNPMARLEVSDGATVNLAQRMFSVHGNSGGVLHTAAFYNNSNYGVVLGAEDTDTFGSIDAGQFVNGILTIPGNLTLCRDGGNVGIGTIVPTALLHVYGNAAMKLQSDSNPNNYADIHFDNTLAGGREYVIGNYGLAHALANKFFIRDNAGGDRFIIDPAGNIGIGQTSPTHLIELSGGAFSDGINWTDFSDKTYKKDIDYNFKYGLKAVEQLKPAYYVHKKDKTNKKRIGFIAQDVIGVVPEVVEGKEGSYGLNYGQLTAVLVNAIKEQQAQIENLKQEINALKQERNAGK